jgi:predicted phage terminase large subunit-like protein
VSGTAGAAQVVVLTRWHQDDLIGWLLEQEGGDAPQHWHVLNLPALAEPKEMRLSFPPTCSVEPEWRETGVPLCPERFPLVELEQIRIRAGRYWWEALYQQRPSPAEGLLFRHEWLRTAPARRSGSEGRAYAPLVLSCDLAFKGGAENDPCGFVLLGLVDPSQAPHPLHQARSNGLQLHPSTAALANTAADPGATQPFLIEVLWAQRHQLDLPGTVNYLLQSLDALKRQGLNPDAVLIEDAANGPAVCQLLRRQIPGLIAIRPQGSKVSRAHAVAPWLEAGQVGFHRPTEALQSELLSFPTGAHDDLVDAFCQGVIWLQQQHWRGRGRSEPPRPLLFSH